MEVLDWNAVHFEENAIDLKTLFVNRLSLCCCPHEIMMSFRLCHNFATELMNDFAYEKDFENSGDGVIPSRDSRYAANMFLFDDRNYSDTKLQFNLEIGQSVFEVPQLRDYGMNDKTTSVTLWCNNGTVEYQLWEDDTYEGHSLVF